MIFHYPFKILEKIIVRAVEVVITNFYRQTLLKAAELMCNFLDIVLERDVRNQAGIADFLNFWDKMQRNSASHHLKEITRFAL
jgi:hypothetical protein